MKITLYRAAVRKSEAITPFLHGMYRRELGDAEVDRMALIKDRRELNKPEIFYVQRIPAELHDDGSITVLMRL